MCPFIAINFRITCLSPSPSLSITLVLPVSSRLSYSFVAVWAPCATMASDTPASVGKPRDRSHVSAPPLTVRKPNVKLKWSHRPSRSDKGRQRSLHLAPRPPSLSTLSRRATAEGLNIPRAAAPSLPTESLLSLESKEAANRTRAADAVLDNLNDLAARLAAGRTATCLASVMDARFFAPRVSGAQPALRPSRGLFATHNGEEVFIVCTFTCLLYTSDAADE